MIPKYFTKEFDGERLRIRVEYTSGNPASKKYADIVAETIDRGLSKETSINKFPFWTVFVSGVIGFIFGVIVITASL